MHLILAPLHGFTDATFRNVYFRHFGGIDEVMAPFISLTHGDKVTALKARDVLPKANQLQAVIPQILGNESREFIQLCRFLHDELGYKEVNWNLGCPIPGIANKKRGSGMLPFPGMIDQLLGEILPNIQMELSIKLRLGWKSADEFPPVAEVLNRYPITNVTVHPRLGIQQYEGATLLDDFERCLPLIRHKIIYNGDIHSFADFQAINRRFASINEFMLGRGVFYNPFLPEMIKAGKAELPENAASRFINFYLQLESEIRASRKFWMSKMKEYWKFYGVFLGLDEDQVMEVLRCKSETEWKKLTRKWINPGMSI
jgi:tRNA-dihydrouridine synthase B